MGKLYSKHAAVCKPRESPEGDSFAVNACLARKGIEDWIVKQKPPNSSLKTGYRITQRLEKMLNDACISGWITSDLRDGLFVEHPHWPIIKTHIELSAINRKRIQFGYRRNKNLKELLSPTDPDSNGDICKYNIANEHFHLEVALPEEKSEGLFTSDDRKVDKDNDGRVKKQHKFEELQCDVSVEEDNRQEWTFTLYDFDNSGRVTREDITRLLHTIYEVFDASVNHSLSSSKTLRVKLSLAPDATLKKRTVLVNHAELQNGRHRSECKVTENLRGSEKKQQGSGRLENVTEQTECLRQCVDENIERRNHYLDLAGIENYTSRFGPGSPPMCEKHDSQAKASNQMRSRSHEPETISFHHRRSQALDTGNSNMTELSHVKVAEVQQRQRGQENNKHFVRSPRASNKNGHLSTSQPGRTRNKPSQGVSMPVNPPSAFMGQSYLYHPVPPQSVHRKSKQKTKDGHQMRKAFQSPVNVVEKEHVRDLPSMVLYDDQVGHMIQRHEHHHHHEHHYHYHHFYQK
ncbi:protein naked cuticle homolog 1 isoform X1 [Xenopus laevis]|uniref:Protein naked cuticle homolog n=2 Tax=Xenopus laevis TaxID=8355 RepID=A0A8J1KI52_XENLA|nr:protein naked cuticle homolog 1 isoform X1 [Xenopus laevis]